MKKVIETMKSALGKWKKSSACAMLGLILASLTVLGTSGCDKIMGLDESKVKDSLLEICNDSLKKNPFIANSINAVQVQDLSLVQESFSKRVGYANIVFRSTSTGKEVTLKYNVKITGSAFDDKQLCEMQLNDTSDGLKLLSLVGDGGL